MMALKERGLWLVLKVAATAVSLWSCDRELDLGNWFPIITGAVSCSHMITICYLSYWLPLSKVHGENGKRLQVAPTNHSWSCHFFCWEAPSGLGISHFIAPACPSSIARNLPVTPGHQPTLHCSPTSPHAQLHSGTPEHSTWPPQCPLAAACLPIHSSHPPVYMPGMQILPISQSHEVLSLKDPCNPHLMIARETVRIAVTK